MDSNKDVVISLKKSQDLKNGSQHKCANCPQPSIYFYLFYLGGQYGRRDEEAQEPWIRIWLICVLRKQCQGLDIIPWCEINSCMCRHKFLTFCRNVYTLYSFASKFSASCLKASTRLSFSSSHSSPREALQVKTKQNYN